MASASATKPPVMAAVRVPPSAWITSQSTHTVRSPSLAIVDDRAQRRGRPAAGSPASGRSARALSRAMRVLVERGSMPYSAVTQPLPCPLRKGGHLLLQRRGADHLGVAELDEHRALGMAQVVAREGDAGGAGRARGRRGAAGRHRVARP